MKNALLISQRDGMIPASTELKSDFGLNPKLTISSGQLITEFKNSDIIKLKKQGYRVKMLLNIDTLNIGQFSINIEDTPPKVHKNLDLTTKELSIWTHYLLQFIATPQQEWLDTLKHRDVEVVDSLPPYGIFIITTAEIAKTLESLPFVAWVGAFKPAYRIAKNLENVKGMIQYLSLDIFANSDFDLIKKKIEALDGKIVSLIEAEGIEEYHHLTIEIDAKNINTLAKLPDVRWLEYAPPPEVEDERSCQVVAEDLNGVPAPNTGPNLGYQDLLDENDLSGDGVTIGICDSGVDTHDNTTIHPDLAGRMDFFEDYTGGATLTDTNGHGSHVAGIALGNASTGNLDPQGFALGQGVAPQSHFGSINPINGTPSRNRAWVKSMVNNDADVMNNSWGAGFGGSGYTSSSRVFDALTRDPDSSSANLEKLAIIFSAGNSGGKSISITAPKEAKNLIVVGNSLNFRPNEMFPSDDIKGIAGSSSRGPAVDGRILPTVVAPGTNIVSIQASTDPTPRPYTDTDSISHAQYTAKTGTSMAAPHVTGLSALLIEWWRNRTGGQTPSQAMIKALLINGAEDIAGGENWRGHNINVVSPSYSINIRTAFNLPADIIFEPSQLIEESGSGYNTLTEVASAANVLNSGDWFYDASTEVVNYQPLGTPGSGSLKFRLYFADILDNIPNNDQGWGRVSLQNIISQSPDSDRGAKIFHDQRHAFTTSGQEYMMRIAPSDTTRPLRITIVWTDARAGAGANPALVNDLDLEVTEVSTGNVYKGNVFRDGYSYSDITDINDTFDNLNNTECVYILNPNGIYEVRVIAASLSASAHPHIATPWQDFAMVIDNAEVPSSQPVSVVPVIDRSGSMISNGYVDITKQSSQQFIDLMNIDDEVALVSFASDAVVEYPTGTAPTLQPIIGNSTKNSVKSKINSIVFGGCTFMGDGIEKARDLLLSATGSKAMLLFSDGYDNKGCDASNPSKVSARDAAALLPNDMPIYSCAMGANSDQELLENLAEDTSGRYYFMPTIDDLFEIYNYMRGQVTGEGIIVNESSTASSSRVSAFVESKVEKVTFSIAWMDPKLRYVPYAPKKDNHINIRLRDPRGKLLPNNSSIIQKTLGKGYASFVIDTPIAGKWYIEVETKRKEHTRYTVGGFVRSNIVSNLTNPIQKIKLGSTVDISFQMFDGLKSISGLRASSKITIPTFSISDLLKKHATKLKNINLDKDITKDINPDIYKLNILRNDILDSDKKDIFTYKNLDIKFRETQLKKRKNFNFEKRDILARYKNTLLNTNTLISSINMKNELYFSILDSLNDTSKNGSLHSTFKPTTKGSHNVIISTYGQTASGSRFERKELISIIVQ